LLLEADLLGDRAESVQAGFGSARPSPGGDFFQGALIVAHGLRLDDQQVISIPSHRPGPKFGDPARGQL
jgi:hypothetical protein